MKVNDAVVGACLIALAIAILVHIQAYPLIPGQNYGPALFPGVIAVGLIALRVAPRPARRAQRGARCSRSRVGCATRRSSRNFLAICIVLVFYIAAVGTLGIHPDRHRLPGRAVPQAAGAPAPGDRRRARRDARDPHAVLQTAARAAAVGRARTRPLVTWTPILTAFGLVFEPYTIAVILASAAFGLFVGAVPGLTATMATALLVPGHVLHAAGAGDRLDRDRDRHGDLLRRHPGRAAAHPGHARLGRVHGRGVRDDEERARRRPRSAPASSSA